MTSNSCNMLIVKEIKAIEIEVECPYCGMPQRGFRSDPSGCKVECDDCHKTYQVNSEALTEIKL
jgi:transposase-like protein